VTIIVNYATDADKVLLFTNGQLITDEVAREIEARRAGVYRLNDAEREGVERGLKAMREGKFASDERIAEIFQKARSSRT